MKCRPSNASRFIEVNMIFEGFSLGIVCFVCTCDRTMVVYFRTLTINTLKIKQEAPQNINRGVSCASKIGTVPKETSKKTALCV